MKIASFNVNSLRSRLPIVTEWLGQHRPDVLSVQETKVQDHDFPQEPLDRLGYHSVFRGQKSYNGVAIFSTQRITDVVFGFDTEPVDAPRLIRARVGGVNVVNTYVPQGRSPDSDQFQYKLTWFARLAELFATHYKPSDPVIWLGDLNIAPLPIDVYDPKALLGHVCYHPDVHAALNEVLNWGFTDTFRMHCDEPNQYTYWDYRVRNAVRLQRGWRLDHIFVTAVLAKCCKACTIDTRPRMTYKPSDHTPIVAEFDWP